MSLPEHLQPFEGAFKAAGQKHGVDPMLLAAICDRESDGGRALKPPGPGGTGDNGHGRGLMQVDDRSWGPWLASHDWTDPFINIEMGAAIFAAAFARFRTIPAALAAYNAGQKHVAEVLAH